MISLMISCEKASELSSKSLDQKLSRKEAFELWFHTRICSLCLELKKQLKTLQLGAKKILDEPEPTCCLSTEAKERIRQTLSNKK
ncbi:MAG: hypothetical protein KDD55_03835 [Bdellovibrionales bacterium]|nr:hypothetical protein [Bdellovibrionales bacterium]